MALVLVKTSDTVDLIHADDPAVSAPEGVEGWFVSATPPQGATVITVRPLNGWDTLEAQSIYSPKEGADNSAWFRFVLERGLVAIDGDEGKARDFVASPGQDHLLEVFTAVLEGGNVPFDRGAGSDSTGQAPANGAAPAAQSRSSLPHV